MGARSALPLAVELLLAPPYLPVLDGLAKLMAIFGGAGAPCLERKPRVCCFLAGFTGSEEDTEVDAEVDTPVVVDDEAAAAAAD